MKRSGKVQFLFWLFLFSIFLYIWIVWVALQTFVLPDTALQELPEDKIALLFILYGILVLSTLAGTVVSIFIENKRYINRFGALFLIIFISFLAGKSIFG